MSRSNTSRLISRELTGTVISPDDCNIDIQWKSWQFTCEQNRYQDSVSQVIVSNSNGKIRTGNFSWTKEHISKTEEKVCFLLTHGNHCAALMCCFDVISIVLIPTMWAVGIVSFFNENRKTATWGQLSAVQLSFPFIQSIHSPRSCSAYVYGMWEGKHALRKSWAGITSGILLPP